MPSSLSTHAFGRSDKERLGEWQAIDPTESAWCLHDGDADEGGEPVKSLVITLARPPPTESEVMWKRGQAHCSASRCVIADCEEQGQPIHT